MSKKTFFSLIVFALIFNIGGWMACLFYKIPSLLEKLSVEALENTEAILEDQNFPQAFAFQEKILDKREELLQKQSSEIDKKEEELKLLSALLENEKQELQKTKEEILQLQNQLSARIVAIKGSEVKNLKSLATTYESMTPEALVQIFGRMKDEEVTKILVFMPSETVGSIFQVMAKSNNEKRIIRLTELFRVNQLQK